MVHSVEFRRELRLEAAARLFELSFSSNVCSCFGPNTSSPSMSMNRISVPKPTIHPLVMLWSLATVVVMLAGFLRQFSWLP